MLLTEEEQLVIEKTLVQHGWLWLHSSDRSGIILSKVHWDFSKYLTLKIGAVPARRAKWHLQIEAKTPCTKYTKLLCFSHAGLEKILGLFSKDCENQQGAS